MSAGPEMTTNTAETGTGCESPNVWLVAALATRRLHHDVDLRAELNSVLYIFVTRSAAGGQVYV